MEVIKCYLVSKMESQNYILSHGMQNKMSISDCGVRLKNNGKNIYYNRDLMMTQLKKDKKNKIIHSAYKISSSDKKSCRYIFNYENEKFIIVVSNEALSLDYDMQAYIESLDHLVECIVKYNRRLCVKKLASGILIVGTLASACAFFTKVIEDEAESYNSVSTYERFYDGMFSEKEFEEMVHNFEESYKHVESKKK